MAKTEKRKREDSASDVEHERPISKKTKTKENEVRTKVKRKEKSHDVSSSDGEISDRPSSKGSKELVVDKTNRNSMNTHLLSSESDNENAMSDDKVTSNDIYVRDSAANGKAPHESSYSSEEEISAEKAVISTSSTLESVKKQIRRMPKFTQELNDDISKLALLLDRDLIEKNDIWILQCPSDMDCSALVSQRLNLDGSCKLDDGEKTYESYSYRNTNPRSATLAVPSERNQLDLRRVPITGNIIVEESVKAVNNSSSQIISEPPSRVEFPENLRIRHPLLGIDFSKQPRTAERITHVSSKKKRHSKKHDESYNGSLSLDVVPSDVLSSKKKKKKHKHCEDDTVPALVEQQLEESFGGSAKKKKKKKHKDNESFS
ncbi:uncharacterized protein LOC128986309 isoform X2 [Macrosteles quadrilineatus]|nr:uncharacterized protein LOC128986309 isoform X2 [Macrosteles quadrilineatus]